MVCGKYATRYEEKTSTPSVRLWKPRVATDWRTLIHDFNASSEVRGRVEQRTHIWEVCETRGGLSWPCQETFIAIASERLGVVTVTVCRRAGLEAFRCHFRKRKVRQRDDVPSFDVEYFNLLDSRRPRRCKLSQSSTGENRDDAVRDTRAVTEDADENPGERPWEDVEQEVEQNSEAGEQRGAVDEEGGKSDVDTAQNTGTVRSKI